MNDTTIEESIFEEFFESNIIAKEKIDYLLQGDFELIIHTNKGYPYYLLMCDEEIFAELYKLYSGNYEVGYAL